MKSPLPLLALFLLLIWACDEKPDPPAPDDGLTYTPTAALRDQSPFPFGVAIQAGRLNAAYGDIVGKEFNSLSAEYEMKQRTIFTGPNTYNWGPTDGIVNFAQAHNQRVHGHALVWHSSVPDWLTNFAGDSAAFETIIRDYIHTVLGRYKGKIASWDVVNEAFEDNQTGALRNTLFRQKMGDDYVARCFQYAREADPDVLLFYNEYGTLYDDNKLAAMLAMIDDFQTRGIPIDGVGFQMHIRHDWPSLARIQQVVDQVKSRGLKIHFSELDIRVNGDGNLTALTPARAKEQQDRYRDIVSLYKNLPAAQQFGITVWGLKDDESWLIQFWGNPEWPLLFDANRKYKLAHKGVMEAF